MSESVLGKLVDGSAARDASHIAIMPVWSAVALKPGTHVGFVHTAGDHEQVSDKVYTKLIGIVDPFLPSDVTPYKAFWLILYPNTTKNLRHEWDHDDIPKKQEIPEESTWSDECRHC